MSKSKDPARVSTGTAASGTASPSWGGSESLDEARELEKQVRDSSIVPIAAAFARNTDDAIALLAFPLSMSYIAVHDEKRLTLWMKALVSTKHIMDFELPHARAEIAAEAERLWEESRRNDTETQSEGREANRRVNELGKSRILAASIQLLLRSVVTSAWTAFECLSGDLWEAAVNARPGVLGQRALSNVRADSSELSTRSVGFKVLAKQGFDLRNCLGTILRNGFDFTKLDGIQKAYAALFGDASEIEPYFGDPTLRQLQLHRNLLVHKAGTVDEAFAALAAPSVPVGTRLDYDSATACTLMNSAIVTGSKLVLFVDRFLTTT
jgi:hypothetical protein